MAFSYSNDSKHSPTFLVVLGMHRSGTSALAGVLFRMGLKVGKFLLKENEFNERGYYEDSRVTRFHDELLSSLGRSWDDERPYPADWSQRLASADHQVNVLVDLIRKEYELETSCVIKDPRISLLLPLWKRAFSALECQPRYAISLRHPIEVADSLWRRDTMPRNKALLLYTAYLLAAERETRGCPRVVVAYECLLKDWKKSCQAIKTVLEINLPELNRSTSNAIDSFLSNDLRHFIKKETDSAGDADNPEHIPLSLAMEVYRKLSSPIDQSTMESLDSIGSLLEKYLASLEPWLSTSRQVDLVRKEWFQSSGSIKRFAEQGAHAALYWKITGGEYSESNSIRQVWHFGVGKETLTFSLPDAAHSIDGIRLDIADRPALCELHGLSIKDPEGNRAWQWKLEGALFTYTSGDLKVVPLLGGSTSLTLISLGFNPHGPLSIPKKILEQLSSGWVIALEVSMDLPMEGLNKLTQALDQLNLAYKEILKNSPYKSTSYASYNADSKRFSKMLENIDNVSKLLSHRLSARDEAHAQQQIQLQLLKENLARAETQLDLLKEVMISWQSYEQF